MRVAARLGAVLRAVRPVDPEFAAALARRWAELPESARTPGQVLGRHGVGCGAEVVHLARHETGHRRLSGQVNHRANLAALLEAGAECLISLTICGAVDPAAHPGTVIVFDDLYFPGNRLPSGSLCTWHDTPGAAGRGHWIFSQPFSEPIRAALLGAGQDLGTPVLAGGCYGHVDGPAPSTASGRRPRWACRCGSR